jgi:hypothetical protein
MEITESQRLQAHPVLYSSTVAVLALNILLYVLNFTIY